MRVAQVVFPNAPEFERKSQRIDFAALRAEHDVITVAGSADVGEADLVHLYAPRNAGSRAFRGLRAPAVASFAVKKRWLARGPAVSVSPVEKEGFTLLPEAVEEKWFVEAPRATLTNERRTVAAFGRPALHSVIPLTLARLHRTRDDIEWISFDAPPEPADLATVDAWIDPAVDEEDYDGFVAEAIVAGLPVVASRTSINLQRLEHGRTGFLVPPNDPNELTHAILTALFKGEAAQQKQYAAKQTAAKFRPRQRLRVLSGIYQSLRS